MAKEVVELEIKSEGIGKLNNDLEGLSENLVEAGDGAEKTADGIKDLGKAGKSAKGGLKSMAGGLKGIGNALKSLGIIGIIVAAFEALKEALERNQKIMNLVDTIMTTISTTFNQLVDVLVDTYNWVTASTENFDAMGRVLKGIMTLALTPMKLTFYGLKIAVQELMLAFYKLKDAFPGADESKKINQLRRDIVETQKDLSDTADSAVEAGKDIVASAGEAMEEVGNIAKQVVDGVSKISIANNLEMAKTATAAKNNAKLAEASLQGLIEKNDLMAEKQRQIRDDETKTFEERLAANTELGEILKNQEKDMLALADTRVKAAAFELAQNKENVDLQVAYKQTLNDRAGIQAQIGGMMSEQLTNEVSLNKELGEVRKEIRNEGLDGMAQELSELESAHETRMELARRAGVSSKEIEEQYLKDIADIRETYRLEQEELDDEQKEKDEADKQKEIDDAKEVNAAKVDLLKQGLETINSLLDNQMTRLEQDYERDVALAEANGKSTSDIDDKFEKKKSALAEKQKKIKIGLATIDMFTSAVAAYNQGMSVPPPAGLVMGPIAAGLAITAGAANIASIMQTPVGSGGGGGGGGISAPTTPEAPAPQMMSGAFELGSGTAPDAIKAFVVTDEMSNSQNQLANIRRRATI